MGLSAPYLDQTRLQQTLIVFLDHIMPACAPIDYRLVGTAAALLQGVLLPAIDIDILVRDRQHVDAFGSTLTSFDCLEAPVWLPETRQYYGSYELYGVELEISTVEIDSEADTIETFGRGPWEHFTLLPCGNYRVPAVALELRLITELYRDRLDRYQPILKFMQQRGCDLDFIRRGIQFAGLPQPLQEVVLDQLKQAPYKPVSG